MATHTTVIVPDIQYPYHDKISLKKILNVIEDTQPDQVVQIGDGIDMPTVSRWAKDTALEYTGTLQAHIDGFKRDFLEPLSAAAPKAKKIWLEGNHDLRVAEYVKKYGPALAGLHALSTESLFNLDAYGVEYVRGPVRVATNTLAIHGHESLGSPTSASAWDMKFSKRYGSHQSFIFGHTHQPFLITRGYGYAGKVTPRFTMNVGSIMDPVAATYVKDGSVSWQMAFGVLRDDGKRVWPELPTMVDRLFYYNGKRY